MRVRSFPPISDLSSRVLILGSMPGEASLRARQYYAHPRNSFWRIMAALLDVDPDAAYEARVAALRERGIALWDVLKSCTREGSLDSDIDDASIVVNGLPAFFRRRSEIRAVCFNGSKAEHAYRKHVLPQLSTTRALVYHRLPSTSPAHAGLPYARKLAAWRAVLASQLLRPDRPGGPATSIRRSNAAIR